MNSIKSDWRTPVIVIIAGCVIGTFGFGVRSVFGLFLEPMTIDRGWSRETFGLALALQNLFWGIGLPFAGAFADKFGATKVIVLGAVLYAAGVYGMSIADTPFGLHLTAGILTGLGVAFTAFTIAIAAMVRVVGPNKRSMVLGLGTAAGSLGQVLFSPISQGFISAYGWPTALVLLASATLVLIPLALLLPGDPSKSVGVTVAIAEQKLFAAIKEAGSHSGFILLTTGFFVCGFHVAFITVHFPAYVRDLGLDPAVGAWSIALIGLMNIAGSFLSGMVGHRYSKKLGLSTIYFSRAIVITGLLLLPKTAFFIYLFAAAMGILWLSTVPLTTGIVAQVFGVRYMATLFGIVFLSHQLGSFIGVWLGGRIYDHTGSYDLMWYAGIALGLLAALIHIPINEKPLSRLSVQGA